MATEYVASFTSPASRTMTAQLQSDTEPLRPRAWWAVLGGWLGFFLLWTLFILGWAQGEVQVSGAVISGLSATLPAVILGLLVWRLVGHLPWPDPQRRPKTPGAPLFVAVHVVAMAVFSIAWTAGGQLTIVVVERIPLSEMEWVLQTYIWRLFMGVLLYVIVAGLSYVADSNKRLRRQERIAARAEAIAAKANLAAMRSQLQPHFLFNALHSISSLIESDPERAGDAMELLGDLLRYAVRERETDLVSLDEEWQFVSDYVELQLIRFGDRVTVSMEPLAGAGRAEVPPFVLQPLVENAFVHGMATHSNEGEICVSANRNGSTLQLMVEDSGGSDEDAASELDRSTRFSTHYEQARSAGTGLENLRLRLESLYGNRAALTVTARLEGGTTAMIELEDAA